MVQSNVTMIFPNIDPVALRIGIIEIRWYALAYVFGIIFGYLLLKVLNKKLKKPVFTKESLDDIITWVVVGIILGGRIGYILFYNLKESLLEPLSIFRVWEGGMSFHGGLVGVSVAMYIFSKKYHLDLLRVLEMLACVAPIGIFLGRIANFINGELYGRTTDVSWGMIFPHVDYYVRHPSQLYEAVLEGLLLFIIMMVAFNIRQLRGKRGCLGGIFLCTYSSMRILLEQWREPNSQYGLFFELFTMGQILSIVMLIAGILVLCIGKVRAIK